MKNLFIILIVIFMMINAIHILQNIIQIYACMIEKIIIIKNILLYVKKIANILDMIEKAKKLCVGITSLRPGYSSDPPVPPIAYTE